METNTTKSPNVRTLCHKHYFGAYANMARHNMYLLLADINTRLGLKGNVTDDAKTQELGLITALTGTPNTTPDVQQAIIKELRRHLPWIETMVQAWCQPPKATAQNTTPVANHYAEVLKELLTLLNKMRNHFSHQVAQPYQFSTRVLYLLRTTFDAARRKTADRFGFTPDEMKHLVRLGKGGKEVTGFKYKFEQQRAECNGPETKNGNYLSTYGVTFFLCLFLERKYASVFTKKIEGLKDARRPEYRATYEVFAAHCIHLPKARLVSDHPQTALLLDMLNELKRCPDMLFDQLPPENQDRFRVLAELQDEDGETEDNYVLLKRHEDRFRQLALYYIDWGKWFSLLHFPVDLGNYHYHQYEKTVDGAERIGSLKEKLIGYKPLHFYHNHYNNDTMPQDWKQLWAQNELRKQEDAPATAKLAPYMPRTTPHYHLPDDNVTILVRNTVPEWPTLATNDAGKYEKEAGLRADTLLMSRYDLFAMVFYGLLLPADKKGTIQSKLVGVLNKRKKLYVDIEKGTLIPTDKGANEKERRAILNKQLTQNYGCAIDDLPQRLQHYLMGRPAKNTDAIATERLQQLIDDTNHRIGRLQQQLKGKRKPGKPGDEGVKAGIMADFLAADMMRFQPVATGTQVKAQGKPTATLYAVLQAKLALYGAHTDTIVQTLRECRLLQAPNQHPFLQTVVDKKAQNIADFYECYLDARSTYLERCKKQRAYQQYHWLHLRTTDKDGLSTHNMQKFARTMLGKDVAHPVVVPRGFFTEDIKALLQDLLQLPEDGRYNASYLVAQYLQQVRGDNFQEFYDWERVYDIYNNFLDEKKDERTKKHLPKVMHPLSLNSRLTDMQKLAKWVKTNTGITDKNAPSPNQSKNNVTPNQRRYNAAEHTEKRIRHAKVQDAVLFMMAEDLIKAVNPVAEVVAQKYYLKNILPDSATGVLEIPLPQYQHTITYPLLPGEESSPHSLGSTRITQSGLKVKNVGDFNKFVRDRRLPHLLWYMKRRTVSRDVLQKELERYDAIREEVFATAMQFEERVLPLYPQADPTSFKSIIACHIAAGKIDEQTGNKVIAIRNAFGHNEYPNPETFTEGCPPIPEGSTYAEYFLQYMREHLSV